MPDLHRIEIKSNGSTGRDTRIEVDGEPLKGVTQLGFRAGVNEPNKLGLEIIAGGVMLSTHALVDNVYLAQTVPGPFGVEVKKLEGRGPTPDAAVMELLEKMHEAYRSDEAIVDS